LNSKQKKYQDEARHNTDNDQGNDSGGMCFFHHFSHDNLLEEIRHYHSDKRGFGEISSPEIFPLNLKAANEKSKVKSQKKGKEGRRRGRFYFFLCVTLFDLWLWNKNRTVPVYFYS
jgi:hypothetical protein